MKKALLLILTTAIVMATTSCTKYVVTPEDVPTLTGHWYLQSAQRYDGYKWQTISTGYENGTFTFNPNGNVSYEDALGVLYGTWDMYPISGGYYDTNGNYQRGYHNVFKLRMHEPNNSNLAIDWIFDDNNFNGSNRFIAIYTFNNYRYEYTFVRE